MCKFTYCLEHQTDQCYLIGFPQWRPFGQTAAFFSSISLTDRSGLLFRQVWWQLMPIPLTLPHDPLL